MEVPEVGVGTLRRLAPVFIVLAVLVVSQHDAFAAPALTANKTTNLNPDGQEITVSGSGYYPNAYYYLAECDPTVPAGGACDTSHFVKVKSNAAGKFGPSKLTVVAKFTGGQDVDCHKVRCAVQTSYVKSGKDRSQEATLYISFASTAPASPKPAKTKAPVPTKKPAAPVKKAATPAKKPVAAPSPKAAVASPSASPSALALAPTSGSGDSGSNTGLIVAGVIAAILIATNGAFIRRRLLTTRRA
jgi:hypothetical protein